jgi:hypothetical protein
MKYLEPVIDRSAEDITNRTVKAFFNVADWQRIYNNTSVTRLLVEFLRDVTIIQDALVSVTTATVVDASALNALLLNIERIRLESELMFMPGMDEVASDWGVGTGVDSPDYLDVNHWEEVLDIIFNMLPGLVEWVVYCGVAAVGQPRFYQHRFRQYGWVKPSSAPVRSARCNVSQSGTGMTRQNGFRRYA